MTDHEADRDGAPSLQPQGAAAAAQHALTDEESAVLAAATALRPTPASPAVGELADLPAIPGDPGLPGVFTAEDLQYAAHAPSHPLAVVLRLRHSSTQDLQPPHRRDLAALFHRSGRTVTYGRGDDGGPWSHRPAPSAGATHPFDLLLIADDITGLAPGTYRYSPMSSQLHPATSRSAFATKLQVAIQAAARRSTPPPATIALVANVHRVRRRYPQPLTLLLRDAGALLTIMHLVATDLGLASCIIGTAGHRPDHQPGAPYVVDCGALVLGRPTGARTARR